MFNIEIILNELKEAEHILKTKTYKDIRQAVSILARYYYHIENLRGKKIYELLDVFLKENYPEYNPSKWTKTLNVQIKKAPKYPLQTIPYVPVTQNELNTIDSLPHSSYRLKRLSFTLLCLAKFCNIRNDTNNDWVNKPIQEIFVLANIPVSQKEQGSLLYQLKTLGLITYSSKVDSTNINVQFIDNESPEVLQIQNFNELGKEYLLYSNKKYTRCTGCGTIIKMNSNRQKYCAACAKKAKKDSNKHNLT